MDGDLAGIFVFILLAATLAFGMAQVFHRRSIQHEERKLELKLQIEQAEKAQMSQGHESQQLFEDRLRVLERIVTDPSADISRQIESLRDIKAEGERAR